MPVIGPRITDLISLQRRKKKLHISFHHSLVKIPAQSLNGSLFLDQYAELHWHSAFHYLE